ncbi:MAG: hypothetical protein ACTHNX_08570, partial [Humibacter sp.]
MTVPEDATTAERALGERTTAQNVVPELSAEEAEELARHADAASESAEISYDEERYPARPQRLRPRAQLRASNIRRSFSDPRSADASNPSYVEWLKRQSMLGDADILSRGLSGQPSMWRNPYARPDARRAIRSASVWF